MNYSLIIKWISFKLKFSRESSSRSKRRMKAQMIHLAALALTKASSMRRRFVRRKKISLLKRDRG